MPPPPWALATPTPLAVNITTAAAINSLLLLRLILNVDDDGGTCAVSVYLDDDKVPSVVVRRRFHFSISSSLGGRWEHDICLVGLEGE